MNQHVHPIFREILNTVHPLTGKPVPVLPQQPAQQQASAPRTLSKPHASDIQRAINAVHARSIELLYWRPLHYDGQIERSAELRALEDVLRILRGIRDESQPA